MAAPGSEKSSKKKTEKKLAAREEAKLLAGFMGVMNSMRKQVRPGALGAGAGGSVRGAVASRGSRGSAALLPVRAVDGAPSCLQKPAGSGSFGSALVLPSSPSDVPSLVYARVLVALRAAQRCMKN